MVRRADDGERHRDRQRNGEKPQREARHRHQQDDSDEDVPADVQAGERRVLVREPGRLERAVRVGALRDRVDKPDVEQARRRDGEEREEEKADQAGGDHRVAEEVVVPAPVEVQPGRNAEDHGPVAPDVDPVRDVDEDVAAERHGLQRVFPADPERILERDQAACVGERGLRAAGREVAHAEVDDDRAGDDQRFADEPCRHGNTTPRRRGRAGRRSSSEDHPHLLTRVSIHDDAAASAISRNQCA